MNILLIGEAGAGKTLFVERYLLGNEGAPIWPTKLCCFYDTVIGTTPVCVCDTAGFHGSMYWWLATQQMVFHHVIIFVQEDLMFGKTKEKEDEWRKVASLVTDADVSTFVTFTSQFKNNCPEGQLDLRSKEGAAELLNLFQEWAARTPGNTLTTHPLVLSNDLVWEDRKQFVEVIKGACCRHFTYKELFHTWDDFEMHFDKLGIPKKKGLDTLKFLFSFHVDKRLAPDLYPMNPTARVPQLPHFAAANLKRQISKYITNIEVGMILSRIHMLLRELNVQRVYSWTNGHAFRFPDNPRCIYTIEECCGLYMLAYSTTPIHDASTMKDVMKRMCSQIETFLK